MSDKKKNANRIVFINILSTVVLNGIAFFTAPLFSRLLGTEGYGIAAVFFTWSSVFSICLGFQTDATLAIASVEYPQKEQIKYQSSVLSFALMLTLSGSVLIIAFLKPIAYLLHMDPAMVLLLLLHAYGLFCVNFLNTKNSYEFHAGRNLVLSLSLSVASVVLSYLFIRCLPMEDAYWGRISATALVYIVFGFCITVWFFRSGKTYYSKTYWKFVIPLAAPLILHSLSNLIIDQSDRVMLQWMSTNAVVGIYSLAATFSSVMNSIHHALAGSWAPFFYEYAKNKKSLEVHVCTKNYLELFTILMLGFLLLTPEVYHLFASKEYWSGIHLIPLLSAGHYFVFLYSFPVNFEFYAKKTKTIAVGTALASTCNIILNYWFITKIGAFGAALATLTSHVLQFLFHHLCARHMKANIPYPFPMKLLAPYGLIVLLAAIWMSQNAAFPLIRWGLGVLLGIFELIRIVKRKSIF